MRRLLLCVLALPLLLFLSACFSDPACTPVCGVRVCGDDGCGGSCGSCDEAYECLEGACALEPTCSDGLANGDEGDVDCGGSACAACEDGRLCKAGADCASSRCEHGRCSSCEDGERNGGEADVDCGGECAACADGRQCAAGVDCASGRCEQERCASCSDGLVNGGESDVDCGGPCAACRQGRACREHVDCASRTCLALVCEDPTCEDGVRNQSETDVDCGGAECAGCPLGGSCVVHEDCAPGACWSQACATAECRKQRDCGDVVVDREADLCLDRRCEPSSASADRKLVTVEARFGSTFVTGASKPQSVVVRFVHPYKVDGTRVSCAQLRTLGGRTAAERNVIDYDVGLNIVLRTLFKPEWVPNQSFYLKEMRVPLAGEVLVYGEAWYGINELNNPTGNRAALDCVEGVNLDTLAADARLTFNFNPSR